MTLVAWQECHFADHRRHRSVRSRIDQEVGRCRSEIVPSGTMAKNLECCGLCNRCPSAQLKEHFRICVQRPTCLDIACIMTRNQFSPSGTNKPGTILLLAHGAPRSLTLLASRSYAAISAIGQSLRSLLWIVGLYCRGVERHNGKGTEQSRVAVMEEQHGKMAVIEISSAAAEITGQSAVRRSNFHSARYARKRVAATTTRAIPRRMRASPS
jgi:hypothetical protein